VIQMKTLNIKVAIILTCQKPVKHLR
jgi:hypothetical protein